ncbi:hypothetical protein [Paraburkholderia sp.]|uniref:hypothetical protein n=1 Tax=Paraburkholderia sp. TaxID=1926495 RepID=UPI00286EEF9F|nr:hypothetical protein [Paraburkholderia sp.]
MAGAVGTELKRCRERRARISGDANVEVQDGRRNRHRSAVASAHEFAMQESAQGRATESPGIRLRAVVRDALRCILPAQHGSCRVLKRAR